MTAVDPRSFDHLPAVFDRFAELVGGPLLDYLTQRMPRRAGRALDLGCGGGQHAELFARHYDEVLGVDLSAPMLELGRTRRPHANVRYEHRDLLDLTPAEDGTFDLVFSAHTLHHVPDLRQALPRIRELVRPGGQAILVDNVDPRRQASRRWFKAEARRALVEDLRRRRRPTREAVEVYRLSTHPAWLDHVTTDVFLTPDEFDATYTAVFPGAVVTPMYRARALHWRHPG
jgi:SAM-dependent methyltransferase